MSTGDPFSAADRPPASVGSAVTHLGPSSETSVTADMFDRLRTASYDTGGIAFITFPDSMDASTSKAPVPRIEYSIEELRHLRNDLPLVICNLMTMKDFAGDILTLPYGILANPHPQPIATRKLKQLPRGNVMQNRFDQGRRSAEDSDNEEIVYRGHPARKALDLTTQWQYRRMDRSNTDDEKAFQPKTAPTCADAQKAENFRKFYRAVVSPSHVRVTAGGRIVPNSRAPAQPVFVWNKDRVAFDTVATSPDAAAQLNGDKYSGTKKLQSIGSSFDSVGMTSSRSSYQKSDSSATAQSHESKDAAAQHTIQANMPQSYPTRQPIKLSHPDSFDPNKPFLYNGHMVVPLPKDFKIHPGMSVVPLNMIGTPVHQPAQYPPQQQVMGAFRSPAPMIPGFQQQNQNPMPGTLGQAASSTQALRPFIPIPPSAPQAAANMLYHHKSTPAMRTAAIPHERMSPKALNQRMIGLQSKLDELDHQLLYNKHQIDEAYNHAQRQHITSQIAVIRGQLASLGFAPIVPQPRTSVQDRRGAAVASRALEVVHPDALDKFAEPEGLSSCSTGFRTQESFRYPASKSLPQSAAAALDTSTSSTGVSPLPALPYTPAHPTFVSKKRLSPSAAKAPEFKPRSMQAVKTATDKSVVVANGSLPSFQSPVEPIMEPKEPDLSVLSPQTSTDSMSPNEFGGYPKDLIRTMDDLVAAATRGSDSLPSADISRSSVMQSSFGGYEHAMQGTSATYQQAPLSLQNPAVGNVGPYLSGYIDPGVHVAGVRDQQFNYSRPLTEAELLARQLYWGNGGKQHQQKGLPKFDGKDFYLPSPTKPSTTSLSQSRSSETSTVVRKYNSSVVTSKASEEYGVLQKLDEEEAFMGPVTPRRSQLNRKASVAPVEQKNTEDNKENVEIINNLEDLDAWCAKNDIHMPAGGTPVTRSKTASLLAKLANIPSPDNKMLRNAKPASIIAAERLEAYGLPKLLAPSASRAVAVASQEFATAVRSPATQRKAYLSIAKYTTPAAVEALLSGLPAEEMSKAALHPARSVSGSAPAISDSDSAVGQFAHAMAARGVTVGKQGSKERVHPPKTFNGAAGYLQHVAQSDACRALAPAALQTAIRRPTSRASQISHVSSEGVRVQAPLMQHVPVSALPGMTAAQSLAAHQQTFLPQLPMQPRAMSGAGSARHQQSYQTRVPSRSSQLSTSASTAPGYQARHVPPMQLQQPQMQYPQAMQFQGQPMQYMYPPQPFQVQVVPGPNFPVPMPQGQPHQGQGHWVWQPPQGPAPPRQGPPPAR